MSRPKMPCSRSARTHHLRTLVLSPAVLLGLAWFHPSSAAERTLISFETRQLTDTYYSEGASAGDIDGDGTDDVVYGPHWYKGPAFSEKFEIYPPVPQNRERYADNFFSWVYDFDEDGDQDVFTVGFPGTPAHVYENPGNTRDAGHWKKHQTIDWVSNESPQFTNLIGDETPELICTRDGFFGFATIAKDKPMTDWTFYPISEKVAPERFGHGLGVGDVDGDGRNDIIFSGGWFQQPQENATDGRWKLHNVSFSQAYGGADMFAYDVDGDGYNDVITSHAAHDFGLGWYRQVREGNEITFEHNLIMGDRPSQNRYGVVFSEPHSVALADIDGDGLKDIVTGKTYYSHHRQSPMWDAGPVVYWFKLVRNKEGVDWVPYLAGNTSGIGRQLSVKDINNDGMLDFVVGGMLGANVLIQSRTNVAQQVWDASQPKPYVANEQRADRGKQVALDDAGNLPGAIEAEAMEVQEITGGKTSSQKMSNFKAAKWSGDSQLFWTGGTPGDKLTLRLPIKQAGRYEVSAIFTTASDYGSINISIDDQLLKESVDLYDYPQVQTTGLLSLGSIELNAGDHALTLEITGANPSAKKAYMVGLDCVQLKPITQPN